ncbi:Hypothetical predicted protein [Paramuricea clavata]|uniref:Uncharacterized protein n=1 Tax=Paramuricea clavata TaxID=317549 RepID=A0A6S7H4Y6_PARCT|nr:Hypothetical predicted protein [Paramuricea clavata]
MFSEEVKQLINRTKTSSSRLDQLRLFLDDKGMIRCEGRIEHSSVSSEAKKPVLLPAKHHVTDLIIQEHHDSTNHTGIKGTLNRIRKRYWILHGRQAAKRVLRKYSVKRCLKKSIDRATLSFEELRTILIEIESTLNNRPITYIYDDEEGISYPLTPSCLLYGRRTTTTPDDSQFEIVSTNESLTRRAQHHKTLLKQFTKQWRREYLLSIREAASSSNNGTRDVIAEGDIVILKNESTKRLFWKIAKVEKLIRSIDGVVRSEKIRVLNSETRKPIIMRRPIQHLIPLEIRSKFGNENEEEQVDVNEESSETQDLSTEPLDSDVKTAVVEKKNRPKRKAAVQGELVRKLSKQT